MEAQTTPQDISKEAKPSRSWQPSNSEASTALSAAPPGVLGSPPLFHSADWWRRWFFSAWTPLSARAPKDTFAGKGREVAA